MKRGHPGVGETPDARGKAEGVTMAEGIVMLLLAMAVAPPIAWCGRGVRVSGPSWFDILTHAPRPANRAARRSR